MELTGEQRTALTEAASDLDQLGNELSKIGGIRTVYAALHDPDETPPSPDTWEKVKAAYPALAEAELQELNDALALIPTRDYRDLVAEKKSTGSFGKGGDPSTIGQGAPVIGLLALAIAAYVVVGPGGGADPCDGVQSRACLEKQERARAGR